MTDFEKQLIKAIEHGCPFCEALELTLTATDTSLYQVSINYEYNEVTYSDPNPIESYDEAVHCDYCGIELWTAETGWIPELQEVVKGE